MTLLSYALALRALCPGRLILRGHSGAYMAAYSIFAGYGATAGDALTNLLVATTAVFRTENAA